MLNIHAFSNGTLFNNDFTVGYNAAIAEQSDGVQVGCIHAQWRGYRFFDTDSPPAPDYSFLNYTVYGTPLPANLLTSCGYGVQNIDYGGGDVRSGPQGGTPAYPNLGYALPELGGWPNTPNTQMDPDFWTEVRTWNNAASVDAALADPTNPFTFKRYISHCRFYWFNEGGNARQPWFRDDGMVSGGQYESTFQYIGFLMPTTSNWTQRSANFVLNCSWSGWTDADVTYRLEGRGQRWQDVEISMYDNALAEVSATQTQLYGPFGETITVNGKSVAVAATPTAESGRARPVVHVGGGSGPTSVTDSGGRATVPAWFKLGATG
jgi:hypothetical protein